MFYKIMINVEETITNCEGRVVSYMEADGISDLFRGLEKRFGLSPDQPGSRLAMLSTVSDEEYFSGK